MSPIPSTEKLVAQFNQGLLADEMAHRFRLRDQAEIQLVEARCAELHNAGVLDLLQLVESESLQRLSGSDFFTAMHFFCRILPELETTPARMMNCVEALVARGGEDLAANQPNAAFRTWCIKDPRRAHEVISTAHCGEELASRYLTFALEAAHAITEARQMALTYDGTCRLSAITALGRIEDDDPASRGETLVAFSALLDLGVDDNLRANMLHATAAILASAPDTHSRHAVDLFSRLCEDAGKHTVHQAAHVLWAYSKILQPDIVANLLKALACLNPANKGTVDEIDLGLQALLKTGYDEAAIAYVTQLLSQNEGRIKLEELDGFTNTLLAGPTERISRVVIQWLLLGDPRLCEGLSKALRGSGMDGPPLDLKAEDLPVSPVAQVFICRKAIGWFFLKPTTATSIVVSILRICSAETAVEVQKLLAETLLLNYSGVRDYLEGLAPDDAATDRVKQCLAENEGYLSAMKNIPLIKELEPSERHRRIERIRISEQMRSVQKHAQSQSVLLSLARHSVLLYGNRSISFIKDDKNAFRPVEMDLKPYGISFEMPRMEIIDPVGLDLTLRVFRVERMTP